MVLAVFACLRVEMVSVIVYGAKNARRIMPTLEDIQCTLSVEVVLAYALSCFPLMYSIGKSHDAQFEDATTCHLQYVLKWMSRRVVSSLPKQFILVMHNTMLQACFRN